MNDCNQLAVRGFSLEFGLGKQIDKIYYEIIKKTGQVKQQNHAQKANFALAIRRYRFLHVAFDNLKDGYYEVSMTLLRSVYENYIQMNYFATFPDAAQKWLEENKAFEQGGMRKALKIKNSAYKMLSNNYAHPLHVESIDPLVLEVVDGRVSLNHYPVYSYSQCELCLIGWIIFARVTLEQMQRVFKAAQIADKQWIKKIVDIEKLVDQYIAEKKYEFGKAN